MPDLFKILLLIGCLAVFWAFGAPPPSISTLVETTATDKSPGKNRISRVAFGSEVALESLCYPGKVTIVDFYSDGCPPCRIVSPILHKAVEANAAVSLRVVDINRPGTRGIDWGSPVSRQHGLSSIPYFVIFDGGGQEIARGAKAKTLINDFLNKR